ncbi:MAG: hypothetical protein JRE23_16650 [Deltaproteobacteria bacterium]|nr:hypothetical protein [Deltaproteobacteria bacterium]
MADKIKFLPTEEERAKAIDAKGVEISKWSDWDVNVITDTFLDALTDSNAHTLRTKIAETIETYWSDLDRPCRICQQDEFIKTYCLGCEEERRVKDGS